MNKIQLGILFIVTIAGVSYYLRLPQEGELTRDICVKGGVYGAWANITEIFYYNTTYPAIANYSCPVEGTTQWCYKLSASKQTCYILYDPPVIEEPIITSAKAQAIGDFKDDWSISLIEQETDFNNDGMPDVIPIATSMNNTFLEIYANDTRETGAYKWASAVCNISGVNKVGKWEYNPATQVWTYTGLLNYARLSNYGLNSSWCPPNNYGFVLFGSGSGDKRYRLNFTQGDKSIAIYTGRGTSIINTATGTPFLPNQRAICRDSSNYIHAVWRNNANTIAYAKSTDNGVTFTANKTIVNSTGSKGTPHISCNGNNITIGYQNYTDPTYNMVIVNSTDNGAAFSILKPVKTLVGGNVLIERRGNSIYVVYEDKDAYPDINFFNSSNGGTTWSADKIIMDGRSLGAGIGTMEFHEPALVVNGTGGSNDEIFVVARSYTTDATVDPTDFFSGVFFTNSTNSGATFIPSSTAPITVFPEANLYDFGQQQYPSITFNTSNSSQLYVSWFDEARNIRFANSTDKGANWANYIINTTGRTKDYPSLTLNNINSPIAFWQEKYTNYNIVYRNYTGTAWGSLANLTVDINATRVNTKWNYAGNCIELVYMNGTASTGYNITYEAIGSCTSPSVADSTPPTFSSFNVNSTIAGYAVNFSIVIADNVALSGYIFETNNTGTWANTTWTSLSSGGTAWNVTIRNSIVGSVVNVSFYANDSSNNWAVFRNYTITTSAPVTDPPGVQVQQYANISSYNSTHLNYSLSIWVYNHYGTTQNINVSMDSNWYSQGWYVISNLANNATNTTTFYKVYTRNLEDNTSFVSAPSINVSGYQTPNTVSFYIPATTSCQNNMCLFNSAIIDKDNAAIQNANFTFRNRTHYLFSFLTPGNGTIPQQILNSTQNPHIFTISKLGYETLNFTANITEKTKWTLTLKNETEFGTGLAEAVWNFITRDIHGTMTSGGVECPEPYKEYCRFIWNYTQRYVTGEG